MSGDNVNPRDLSVFRAKLAQTAELWDDMVGAIREVTKFVSRGGPTVEEGELLCAAFHRAVTERRAALRVLRGIDPETPNTQTTVNHDYHKLIAEEMQALCSDAIKTAQEWLKTATDADLKVLLTKMIGDHHRYLREVNSKEASLKAAEEAYDQAAKLAEELTVAHPLRLQLGLAQLVLYMDHAQRIEKARQIAEAIVANKFVVVNSLPHFAYRDSGLTMQLVEDRCSALKLH